MSSYDYIYGSRVIVQCKKQVNQQQWKGDPVYSKYLKVIKKFGETLKSKNPVAQVNELLAKIVAYNLTVVIHEMYENGIEPNFLNQTATDKRQ